MQQQDQDGLPPGQRRGAVAAIAVAIALAVIDSSIANVALPAIASDLHVPPADAILVVNAYQIAVIMSLLPLASLGEKLGYERIYRCGLILFIISSFFCAMADSLTGLTLARIAQGFGAAGLMSVNTALVRLIYPQSLLGRGMGINALVVASSSVLGPGVASAVLSVAHWPWIFALNIPVGLLALALALRFLPSTPRASRRFDAFSAILSAGTFGLLMTGAEQLARGASGLAAVLLMAAGLVCGALLWRRQSGRAAPLLPVDLLRIPIFALSIATSVGSFAAQMMTFVALPFFFQHDLGRTQVETGLLMMPWPLALIVMSPLAGRVSDRVPAGLLGGVGLAGMAMGLGLLAFLPPAPDAVDIGWRMALCGLGFGLFQTPNNRTLLTAAPRERSGGASGMLSTARLTGQTLGAAMAALCLRTVQGGPQFALLVAACIAAAAALISFTRLRAAPR
ncbi:MFS transporter [Teichococcus vastitatis]|uniref:MFS transporter n=1 Tax=Teichococcus vastitatis TaxID=2307076 RepID=A0ABS9W2E9_9PROT|nr:MFS transporter [Pseudoroseomonas vastitatis]MCI0753045.1 MFS transporter [Pseudoroseomonas vastitatis]